MWGPPPHTHCQTLWAWHQYSQRQGSTPLWMMRMFSGFFCVFVYGFSCEYKATLAEIITYDHLQRKIMQSSSNTHTRTHTPSPIMSNRIWLLICLCCIWSRSEWWRKQVVRGGCVWIEHKCHWCCYRSILRWLGVFFYTFFFFFFLQIL